MNSADTLNFSIVFQYTDASGVPTGLPSKRTVPIDLAVVFGHLVFWYLVIWLSCEVVDGG